ncbi:hypothetical protein [Nocardia nova]|nr:hypothetical protein [Nocardia nova]
MDDVERASLIRVGIDPDGDSQEVAEQVRVSDYLVCYALWLRNWGGMS